MLKKGRKKEKEELTVLQLFYCSDSRVTPDDKLPSIFIMLALIIHPFANILTRESFQT